MIIGIDGNEANVKTRVGVGQYAYNVLVNLYKLDNKNEYYIYLKDKPLIDMPPTTNRWHYIVFGPKQLWTKVALPIRLFTQKIKLNLFFSPSHYSPYPCPCPTIPTIHDLGYLMFQDQFNKKDLYQLTNWTKKSILRANYIVAVSEFTKNEIVKTYNIDPKRIFVAYNGVGQPAKVDSRISQKILNKFKIKNKFFLYIGTLKPNKNIPFIIKAFAKFNNPDYNLVIAGKKGWLYKDIFATVKNLKIENRVIFTDFINEIEKWTFYKNATSLVIPSLYEGFGIPAIEAQKIGTPVIASNIAPYKEVIGKSGILVNPNNIDELVRAFNTIIDSKNRDKYIKLGLKQTKIFTWENTAKSIIKAFNT